MVDNAIEEDRARSVEQCAFFCGADTGAGNRFIYGTNEYGADRCNSAGCKCYCEEKAENAKCTLVQHDGYNLYRNDKRVIRPWS